MSAVYFTSQKSQIEYNVISDSHSNEISCVIGCGCFNSRDRICRPKVEHGATFFLSRAQLYLMSCTTDFQTISPPTRWDMLHTTSCAWQSRLVGTGLETCRKAYDRYSDLSRRWLLQLYIASHKHIMPKLLSSILFNFIQNERCNCKDK